MFKCGVVKCTNMAHGLNTTVKRGANSIVCKSEGKAGIGSRRIFAPQFKLQVLDSYRNDVDCKGNQRATARKYGIHRRQIQKWLQVENNLRNSVIKSKSGELSALPEARKCGLELALRSCDHRQRDDVSSEVYSQQQQQRQAERGREREAEAQAEQEQRMLQRIGGCEARDTTADKRVPDIPQHSDHHWHTSSCLDMDKEVDMIRPYVKREYVSPVTSPHLYAPAPVAVPVPVPAPLPVAVAVPSPVFKCECPDVSPLPLDFTTHSRRTSCGSPRGASPVCIAAVQPIETFAENAAPMDLSLKKPYMPYPRISVKSEQHTPVFVSPGESGGPLCRPSVIHTDHPLTLPLPLPDSQIWDLSTKGVKRPHEDDVTPAYSYSPNVSSSADVKPVVQETKPVKLFKPYLLDQTDDSSNNSNDNKPVNCIETSLPDLPYPNSNALPFTECDVYYYNNNNNNNNNSEYSYYKDEAYPLCAGPHGNYYCPLNSDYYLGSNINLNYGDEVQNSLMFKKNNNLIRQRQSYSLDFKLSAIQCYYSDEICKGNQRAVATKYKIHRRQVQKWLKQEEELRQRNETSKLMHIVR